MSQSADPSGASASAGPTGTRDAFIAAMRNVAATVTIVTAYGPSIGRAGLTATAVCSLSVDPPTLLACIGRGSLLATTLRETSHFAINVLGPQHVDLAVHFAGGGGIRGPERFAIGRWVDDPLGPPVLEDAVASFVCAQRSRDDHDTHAVVIGTVETVRAAPDVLEPLMYHHRRYVTVSDHPIDPTGTIPIPENIPEHVPDNKEHP